MRRRTQTSEGDLPGQDSFMDVVANLVGILLIVVMLVGFRTRDVLVERERQAALAEAKEELPDPTPVAAYDPEPVAAAPEVALQEAAAIERTADDIEREMQELARQIKLEGQMAELKRAERTQVQMILASAKVELDSRTQKLDQSRRESLDLVAKVHEANAKIVDLSRARSTVESQVDRPVPLPHVPTPMAQTVFGRELHFRLKDDRLLYVPWDAMVEELKLDAEKSAWKLRDSPRIEERIGPFEGYRMEYALVRKAHVRESAAGVATMQSIELESFTVEPIQEPAGEPIEVALAPGSDFSRRLGQVSPKAYTVTLWVYPDSFRRFREIREALMQRGFLTASRPMPADQKIGGSPSGSRSMTQ
ncbi:MAG TPA: hypothetical protein VGN57_17715 [Pirellulaceae bacterium]|nr:hypothetical protein [Pirellulaceae bacterium]